MKTKDRLQLNDTGGDMLLKMSEGNPGATTVMLEMLMHHDEIDPDAIGGGLFSIMMLDTLGIYGSRIWMFYKDVCNQDISQVFAIMRGWQLGYLTREVLDHAIDHRGTGLGKEELFKKVQERLPNFTFIKK